MMNRKFGKMYRTKAHLFIILLPIILGAYIRIIVRMYAQYSISKKRNLVYSSCIRMAYQEKWLNQPTWKWHHPQYMAKVSYKSRIHTIVNTTIKKPLKKRLIQNLTYILCYNISYVYNYSCHIPSQKQKTHWIQRRILIREDLHLHPHFWKDCSYISYCKKWQW